MSGKIFKASVLLALVFAAVLLIINYTSAQPLCPAGQVYSPPCARCVPSPLPAGFCPSGIRPFGGEYNSCGVCACPSGKVECSGQCQNPASTNCKTGQTYDSCLGCRGKEAVVLGPDIPQNLNVDKTLININREASNTDLILIKEHDKQKFTITKDGQIYLGQTLPTLQGITLQDSSKNLFYGLLDKNAVGNALMIEKQIINSNIPQTLFTLDPNGNLFAKGNITTSGALISNSLKVFNNGAVSGNLTLGGQLCFGATDCRNAWPASYSGVANQISVSNNTIGLVTNPTIDGSLKVIGNASVANLTLGNGNELYFTDNGQIRSSDNNHRLLFRRSENKMELREWGDIIFSPGATTGNETAKVVMKNNGNVGIGTTSSPIAKLQVNGPIATAFQMVSSDYTISDNDSIIYGIPPTTGHITITLPSASNKAGRMYTIKSKAMAPGSIVNVNSYVNVNVAGGTIDTLLSYKLDVSEAIMVISDGSNWLIISK